MGPIFSLFHIFDISPSPRTTSGGPRLGDDPGSVNTGVTRENPGKKIRHSPVEIRSIRPGETDFRVPPARFPRREALNHLSSSRDQPLPGRRIRATEGACLGVGGWGNFSSFGRPRIRNSLPRQKQTRDREIFDFLPTRKSSGRKRQTSRSDVA